MCNYWMGLVLQDRPFLRPRAVAWPSSTFRPRQAWHRYLPSVVRPVLSHRQQPSLTTRHMRQPRSTRRQAERQHSGPCARAERYSMRDSSTSLKKTTLSGLMLEKYSTRSLQNMGFGPKYKTVIGKKPGNSSRQRPLCLNWWAWQCDAARCRPAKSKAFPSTEDGTLARQIREGRCWTRSVRTGYRAGADTLRHRPPLCPAQSRYPADPPESSRCRLRFL